MPRPALTPLSWSPITTPQAPFKIVASPNGQAIYVLVTGALIGYTINPASGALTQVSGVIPTGDATASDLKIDPSGKFIYAVESSDNQGIISVAAVDAATGALTSVSGSPFATGYASSYSSLAVAAVLP